MPTRKTQRSEARNNLKILKKQVETNPAFKGAKVVEGLTEEKMSVVVMDFIAPYIKFVDDKASYERLVSLAIVAWNVSLIEGTERQASITKTREALQLSAGSEAVKDFDQLLPVFMKRKKRYFADNKRMILDFRIAETRDEYRLAIISTPGPVDPKNQIEAEPPQSAVEPRPKGIRQWFSRETRKG